MISLALLVSGCRTAELNYESSMNSASTSFESSFESDVTPSSTDTLEEAKEFSVAKGVIWNSSEEKLKAVFQFPENVEVNEVSKTGHVIQTDDKVLSFDQGMVSFIYPNSKIVNSVLYIFRNNIF